MSREEKVEWLINQSAQPAKLRGEIRSHLHPDPARQEIYEEFSENTVSNFFIPYGIAPNFLINNEMITVPLAIEESSVVAAASHAARFWSAHGGFHARVIDTLKIGQVHFTWTGSAKKLHTLFDKEKNHLLEKLDPLTERMRRRGGGISSMELVDRTGTLDNYYQLHVSFYTADAMGANFINSVLEELAQTWKALVDDKTGGAAEGELTIIMAILSNYTPESRVEVYVEAPVNDLQPLAKEMPAATFAGKFVRAVEIARNDTYRAVTHNKGIFNGMDAVVIATGNDFRAVEACGHAYAARDGMYRSLSEATLQNGIFRFTLDVPLAVGTVGGLTSNHPMARQSMGIMNNPDAPKLMKIIAAAGLANNFSAVRSLVTSGIQQGHMKMHLANILRQLGAGEKEKEQAILHFKDKTVSHHAVKEFLETLKK